MLGVSPLMTSATIKLFLPHGDAKRLRVGEVSNWTDKALAAPRTELDDLLLREEAESAGIYFLFGSDPESGDALTYIGEAEVIRDRLKQQPNGVKQANGVRSSFIASAQ